MSEKKYPIKSEKYKGVYQRKDGLWYYRYKRIFVKGEKPVYYQKGGFETEKIAYEARMDYIKLCQMTSKSERKENNLITFGEYFRDFLENGCDNDASRKKYESLYSAQLKKIWGDRNIHTISDADIENLLLSLAIYKGTYTDKETGKVKFKGYSESYQSSFRKMLKVFYKYVHSEYDAVSGYIAQNIDTKPQKLKVLSLFSGIGAPERALENIGVDFELVNFCEIDDDAAYAYHLLHNVPLRKNLEDVEKATAYWEEILSDFDIMVFGSPCQDFSRNGKQKGLFVDSERPLPTTNELYFNEIDNDPETGESQLTRSGLIYRALQIAIYKRPKFMVIENVTGLISKTFEKEFNAILRNLQDIGYTVHFQKLNSKDFGVPQNRPRVFMFAIRDDISMGYQFPEPMTDTPLAKDWFYKDVADEYYIDPADYSKLDRDSFAPFYSTEYIHCITTNWGNTNKEGNVDAWTQQQLVKDEKGIRCLSSEELMIFQGFEPKDAQILWKNGYTRGDIGKLVGNSITVNVMEEIFRQFVFSIRKQVEDDIVPTKIIKAKVDGKKYTHPLFAYAGNKFKLLPFIDYLLPANIDQMTFYDLFSGSGTIAINSKAERIIMNEKDPFLYYIYKGLTKTLRKKAWKMVENICEKYNLPHDCKTCPKYKIKKKEGAPREEHPCYECMLKYESCREEYNKIPYDERVEKYWYWGLALVYHSFNASHVQHNQNKGFNSPFGAKKCNMPWAKENFFRFAKLLYKSSSQRKFQSNIEVYNKSYDEFPIERPYYDETSFFYLDPPYFASTATYNSSWKEPQEIELYKFLDNCTEKGIYWMLSNVIKNNGDDNPILIDWIKKNQGKYYVYIMQRDYSNSSYNRKNIGKTVEVAITNYRANSDSPWDNPTPLIGSSLMKE